MNKKKLKVITVLAVLLTLTAASVITQARDVQQSQSATQTQGSTGSGLCEGAKSANEYWQGRLDTIVESCLNGNIGACLMISYYQALVDVTQRMVDIFCHDSLTLSSTISVSIEGFTVEQKINLAQIQLETFSEKNADNPLIDTYVSQVNTLLSTGNVVLSSAPSTSSTSVSTTGCTLCSQ